MRNFATRILIGFIIPILTFIGLVICITLTTPKLSNIDFDGGLKIKQNLLANKQHNKKIIFIGGSNLAMGLDSKQLEQRFKEYSIINYGHKFQFGIEFYLREILPFIKKGDIIVLVPEYQLILKDYFGDNYLNPIFFENINTQNLTFSEFFDMLPYSFTYFHKRITSRNKTEKDILDHNKKIGFNKFGDLTVHWQMKHMTPLPIYSQPQKFKIKGSTNKRIIEFIKYCNEKEIKILLIPPAYAESSFNVNQELINWNVEKFKELGLTFMVEPDYFKFPDSLFFDTPYHLQKNGTSKKTKLIAELIEEKIKTNSSLSETYK